MKYYVYGYKPGSRSAKALALALNGKVLRHEGSLFEPRHTRKVINWGSTDCPYDCLNSSPAVSRVSNKLTFFRHINTQENSPVTPRWTESREEALGWLSQPNQHTGFRCRKVVSRTVLNGHSGQGIVITDRDHRDDLPDAPLYVEYVPKDAEYRVHVFNGEVIDVQRKVRDPDQEPSDWHVRSHQNGFIYTRHDSEGLSYRDTIPVGVTEQAERALSVSGLTFGGVDVLWNEKRSQAFVLEVNTACGLEGATADIYADAIRRYYES